MSDKIYTEITEKFIEKIEQGVAPWKQLWKAEGKAYNNKSNKDYNLLNQLFLTRGGAYATEYEWKTMNATLKKKAKEEYAISSWKSAVDESGAFLKNPLLAKVLKEAKYRIGKTVEIDGHKYRVVFCLKWQKLYHISQVKGGVPKREVVQYTEKQRIESAEKMVKKYLKGQKIRLVEGSNEAFYRESDDSITIPAIGQYDNEVHYYATLIHEMVHSTGIKKRLDRKMGKRHGDTNYAKEELVAELGCAFLLNSLGIETDETFDNSASYLDSWLKALREDAKLLYNACAGAEKACKFITA